MMAPQILTQRLALLFLQKRLQHHIAAAAPGEVMAIFLAQGFHSGVAVLAIDFPAFVAVASVKAAFFSCHLVLLHDLIEALHSVHELFPLRNRRMWRFFSASRKV
jgi:hypothetical protein